MTDPALPAEEAERAAAFFGCLADPTRVRLLHAASVAGPSPVGVLARRLGIGQSTCSHHLRKLADADLVVLREEGTSTAVEVNTALLAGPWQVPDLLLGLTGQAVAAPPARAEPLVRALGPGDWDEVRRIYAEGIATGAATFETDVPGEDVLASRWAPGHRLVAELDGEVTGWAALTPVSARPCYAGVAEVSIYVGSAARGRGVGRALLGGLVRAADRTGLWTLQSVIFPENRACLALHRAAGFRTVGVRERIGVLRGRWQDTVLVERRRPDTAPGTGPVR
ncbi:helix-turn-helix domain-containing GNAT family N-acetyltransferase [Saccharopolyspora sp. MS10]|uniref:helix-turn-helix domain-containing GNAT family N-acetyltransferase n=1 Tax=Saccharopolyspora sp. MS10 TaxID=3385973 RepID=UPI0039A1187A